MMRLAADSDVHLEADVKATHGNKNGFPDGEWVPALSISYELTKVDTGQKITGEFMQMVANDGPHYGDNVKLAGPGKYHLTLNVSPPGEHFGRHTDKETGVGPWFKPFAGRLRLHLRRHRKEGRLLMRRRGALVALAALAGGFVARRPVPPTRCRCSTLS
ncbi:MAG: iron transporter [Thermomicrobiales bacterium]